jgi:MinD-like ATPase involved in chromosome partitioning or flagellar assembly
MSLFCLCSAHGSPGVTTTALALAGVWPEERRCLLVEADPFGGVIAARFGLKDTPGLASLASVARRGLDTEVVWRHAQQLPGGLPVLVGPPSAEQAHAVLRDFTKVLADWCAAEGALDVIVDCGRIAPGSPVYELMVQAERVLVLTRPSPDQLRPAAHQVRTLDASAIQAGLLLVGDTPYGPVEVAAALGVDVAGTVAFEARAAEALTSGTGGGDLRITLLVRSAASLAESLLSKRSDSTVEEPDARPASWAVEVSGEVWT